MSTTLQLIIILSVFFGILVIAAIAIYFLRRSNFKPVSQMEFDKNNPDKDIEKEESVENDNSLLSKSLQHNVSDSTS